MGMRNLTREIGSKTFTANQKETIDLPEDYALIDLMVELDAGITVSGGNTSGTLNDVAPAQLISNIEIRANGRDVIKSLDFEGLVRLTQQRYGTLPNNTVLANADAQTNTRTYTYAIIPFAMWRAVKPFDTIFNAQRLTTFEAIITFGSATSIYSTDGNRTTSVVDATVSVSSKDAVGVGKDKVLAVNKESTLESTITATSSEHKIPLNYAKDLFYRALTLKATDGGALSGSIINNIKLQSGGVTFYNLNGRRTRNRNKLVYGLESLATGYYTLDFSEDGRIFDSLDTGNLSSLDLILDVTVGSGTTKVKVYTTEIVIPTQVS